jgi:hypothetical protein
MVITVGANGASGASGRSRPWRSSRFFTTWGGQVVLSAKVRHRRGCHRAGSGGVGRTSDATATRVRRAHMSHERCGVTTGRGWSVWADICVAGGHWLRWI